MKNIRQIVYAFLIPAAMSSNLSAGDYAGTRRYMVVTGELIDERSE